MQEEIIAKLNEGIAPATGQPLSEIAAEIFGHVTDPVGPGQRSGRKILERKLRGPMYVNWYPEPAAKNLENEFRLTEIQERRKEKLERLKLAGKGPPKKGSGKRAKKSKGT